MIIDKNETREEVITAITSAMITTIKDVSTHYPYITVAEIIVASWCVPLVMQELAESGEVIE